MTDTQKVAEVRMCSVGPWPMNSYAIICRQSGQSVLIDPGAEPERLQEMLAGSQPIAILLTHSHPDHVGALEEMLQRLQVPLIAHPGPHHDALKVQPDRALLGGASFEIGQVRLQVYHAPGHCADQICFVIEDMPDIIVGDTVFAGGPGKTWSADDFETTLGTLRGVVLSWPDESICHPGHGPAFRLGDKRAAIEEFLKRDYLPGFFGDASWE